MSYENQDTDKGFTGDDDNEKQSKKKDLLLGKSRKESKKGARYVMFDEEDSDESSVVSEDVKSPSKMKKSKAFKFSVKKKEKEEKKDKEQKKEEKEKEKKKEDKEGRKIKLKSKKKSKHVLHEEPAHQDEGEIEKPIFGVALAVAVERNRSHDGIELPALFRECIDYIEEHGLSCEGIYRISGVKSKVQMLKDNYNRQLPVYLEEHEPNIVASLLKQFLRELPEPVLTTVYMPKFEEASVIKNERRRLEQFSKLISELPISNRLLLSWMIVHMMHVIERQKENKMTLQNVSIVLSPTMQISHRVLNVLFSHAKQLFRDTLIKRYKPPIKPTTSKWSLELPDNPSQLEEELAKQESLLNALHEELNAGVKDSEKEEQLWEVQRVVTQLKRKIKFAKKTTEKVASAEKRRKEKEEIRKSQCSNEDMELRLELREAPVKKHTSQTSVSQTDSPRTSVHSAEDKRETLDVTAQVTMEIQPHRTSSEHVNKAEPVSVPAKQSDEETVEQPSATPQSTEEVTQPTSAPSQKSGEVTQPPSAPTKQANEEVTQQTSTPSKTNEEVAQHTSAPSQKPEEEGQVSAAESTNIETEKSSQSQIINEEVNPPSVSPNTADEGVSVPPNEDSKDQTQNLEDKSEPMVAETTTKTDDVGEADQDKNLAVSESLGVSGAGSTSDVSVTEPDETNKPRADVSTDVPEHSTESDSFEQQIDNILEREEDVVEDSSDEETVEEEDPEAVRARDRELIKDFINEDMVVEDEELLGLQEELCALQLEEEELLAIKSELNQKIETETSEIDRLHQEIAELHYLRQDSDLEEMSSSSDSSYESEDEDDLQEILNQLLSENEKLETQNAEMCQKIHEERMICLEVKVQIGMIQQKQLESSVGNDSMFERDLLLF